MQAPREQLGRGIAREQEAGKGKLKIFFGYAPGTGKTRAMLEAAYSAVREGVDVVAACVNARGEHGVMELLADMERSAGRGGELDLDALLARRPQLVALDELAHANAPGSRHGKRYQDVAELLAAGIDVYTTANVQDIESLSDIVAAVAGQAPAECIPDTVFDHADAIVLVDLEPDRLLERLAGRQGGAQSPSLESLWALREIAMRRCADRIKLRLEASRGKRGSAYRTDEHVLVCLSSSPSNARIIRTASRMASAFRGAFTALFVQTPQLRAMSDGDKARLSENMRLAKRLGAAIETVYGDDIPLQIAEFARLCGVTKIVIGRSAAARKSLFGKPILTERLIALAPGLDIHIIPDGEAGQPYRFKRGNWHGMFALSVDDVVKSVLVLLAATLVGLAFSHLGFTEANIITVYILGVLILSVITTGGVCSLLASAVSVLVFNFFFTAPRFTFHVTDKGYPVTFLIMFVAALLAGTLAARLKESARQSVQAAYRMKVLLETNQLLQKAKGRSEIVAATAGQLVKLLGREVTVALAGKDELEQPLVFSPSGQGGVPRELDPQEQEVALWVLHNNRHAGATTDSFSGAKCLYLAIRTGGCVYGVVGIAVGEQPLDAFENGVLLSILGECALAMESEKNAREKVEAAILAKNEQLRANLLRTISHDLRTPLTAISGHASNLLSNGEAFDEQTKRQIYADIRDDSLWLINLVENLLSVSRIENGQMHLNLSVELLAEVVDEALRHADRSTEHHLTVHHAQEYALVRVDAKLIVQVLINLIDNAIKYTPPGSHIAITSQQLQGRVAVSVVDDGPGIPDAAKARVFDMFFSAASSLPDSRRSLGLGLYLCKAIIHAHHGEIYVSDNLPRGTVFTFTLPAEEVNLHE